MTAPHAHVCAVYMAGEVCAGPCVCACGAVLEFRPDYREHDPARPMWWHTPSGKWHRFPDPNEPERAP